MNMTSLWMAALCASSCISGCKSETEKAKEQLREAGKAAGEQALIAEPANNLPRLLKSSFQSEQQDCPSAPAVPANLEDVKDGAYFVSGRSNEWQDPGWTCRQFRIDGPQRWQYEVVSSPTVVTVYARRLAGNEVLEQSLQAKKASDAWLFATMPTEARHAR